MFPIYLNRTYNSIFCPSAFDRFFCQSELFMKLPRARTEDLLEQNLKNETSVYDLLTDKAFDLNETLSVVYRACGENLTFDNLKNALNSRTILSILRSIN